MILQSVGLVGSFHPSSTCGACGNPYRCRSYLIGNFRGLPHSKLVNSQTIVPQEAAKAAVNVAVNFVVGKAHEEDPTFE